MHTLTDSTDVITDHLTCTFGDRLRLDGDTILIDGAPRGSLAAWRGRVDRASGEALAEVFEALAAIDDDVN
jgi:hypothetical protein